MKLFRRMRGMSHDPLQLCNGKKRYPNHKSAKSAVNLLMMGLENHRPDYLRIYYCPECGGHHLTKTEEKETP